MELLLGSDGHLCRGRRNRYSKYSNELDFACDAWHDVIIGILFGDGTGIGVVIEPESQVDELTPKLTWKRPQRIGSKDGTIGRAIKCFVTRVCVKFQIGDMAISHHTESDGDAPLS